MALTGTHHQDDTGHIADDNLRDQKINDHETRISANESSIASNTSALAGKQSTSAKGQANGYAALDSTGKVPPAQIPAVAVNDTFAVANQAEMLALAASPGDIAFRNDVTDGYYQLTASPASTLGNWIKRLFASGGSGVTSINGTLTGPVTGIEVTANKGVANGYASLDASGTVPAAQIPASTSVVSHVNTYHKFDFRRYGAVGDGVTDNTTAFNSAIADILATPTPGMKFQNSSGAAQSGTQADGGGELHIPAGTYVIGNVVLEHRMRIVGEGWGSVLLRKPSTSGNWIQNRRDGTRHAAYIQIANLTLNGNRANQSSTGDLVVFNGDTTFTYTDTKDEDFDVHNKLTGCQLIQGKGNAVHMIGSGENSVSDCDIRDFDAVGIWSEGFDNRITNNTVGWCGAYCFRIDGDSVKLNANKGWYSTLAAFYITSDQGSGAGNEAQDAGQQGFLFDGANGWAFQGTSDSSSRLSSGTYAGLDVYNSHYLNLQVTIRNRYRGDGSFGPCKDALNHAGGSDNNFGEIVAAKGVWGVQNSVKAGSSAGTGTVLRVNGVPIT